MRLTLIAGAGRLPELIAPHADHVAALEGTETSVAPAELFRLETLGGFLDGLVARGTTHVCLAGGVPRPRIDPARVDAATLPLLPRLAGALGKGDDGALRVALALFEARGITPLGAHEIRPDLLPPRGPLGRHAPDAAALADADRAFAQLGHLGAADLGQACVVAGAQTLAVEAMPGTDWMLRGLALARADAALAARLPRGGVLAKAPKPGQDRRADLPAIGPETIRHAAEAGLTGIAVASGGVMVLDRADCADLADAAGLTLWVAG